MLQCPEELKKFKEVEGKQAATITSINNYAEEKQFVESLSKKDKIVITKGTLDKIKGVQNMSYLKRKPENGDFKLCLKYLLFNNKYWEEAIFPTVPKEDRSLLKTVLTILRGVHCNRDLTNYKKYHSEAVVNAVQNYYNCNNAIIREPAKGYAWDVEKANKISQANKKKADEREEEEKPKKRSGTFIDKMCDAQIIEFIMHLKFKENYNKANLYKPLGNYQSGTTLMAAIRKIHFGEPRENITTINDENYDRILKLYKSRKGCIKNPHPKYLSLLFKTPKNEQLEEKLGEQFAEPVEETKPNDLLDALRYVNLDFPKVEYVLKSDGVDKKFEDVNKAKGYKEALQDMGKECKLYKTVLEEIE